MAYKSKSSFFNTRRKRFDVTFILSLLLLLSKSNVVVGTPAPSFAPTELPLLDPEIPQLTPEPTTPPTPRPTPVPTDVPTFSNGNIFTPEPTPLPTGIPTGSPTIVPTPLPTDVPTADNGNIFTPEPTPAPTQEPTVSPTEHPTDVNGNILTPEPTPDTPAPSQEPTVSPTEHPTDVNGNINTPEPTPEPTQEPTTPNPTGSPTFSPTSSPTCEPFDEIDIIFVLDESNSVGPGNYEILKTSLVDFVDRLPFGTNAVRVGLIEFSGIFDEIGFTFELPYADTNLREVAIQDTIDLFEYDEMSKNQLLQRIGNLTYSAFRCENETNPDCLPVEPEYQGFNTRRMTCISCAFQFMLQEYFPTVGNVQNASTGLPRERFVYFIGDGVPTRGNPEDPEQPLQELRDEYPFSLIYLPVLGNTGFDTSIFGSAFDPTTDFLLPVDNYTDLDGALSDIVFNCLI